MITFSQLGLIGNLGNQLFQIASITGIASTLKTHATFPEWKYEPFFNPLPHSNIGHPERIEEASFSYTDYSYLSNKDYDFKGFFQSEKYWQGCKEQILNQFTFNDAIKDKVATKYKDALSGNHVAISIRRGDFVCNPNYFQLPITYYLNAYYEHFKGYNIIIFSDDFYYCKAHFKSLQNVYYADALNDIEQLCLMSLCSNHIISNSTFSWWGAYLSQSENVIRPEKNFAGPLAKKNSEKDYWPEAWEVFKDYRVDLSDTTFIIPVFYDHNDRRQNVELTLSFINTYFDTNILIGEQGGNAFEWAEDYADYVQFDMPVFHRTKIINELVKQATTSIIINWDCDNICAPAQLYEAVQAIRNGADIAYPFDGTVYRVPRIFFNNAAKTLDVTAINEKRCVTKHSSVGHAVVMSKESFVAAGMENENFVSWSCEDSERYNRYLILGLTVQRIAGAMYHMDHFIGVNSCSKNPYFKKGESEFVRVATMQKEQLKNYISEWEWVN